MQTPFLSAKTGVCTVEYAGVVLVCVDLAGFNVA